MNPNRMKKIRLIWKIYYRVSFIDRWKSEYLGIKKNWPSSSINIGQANKNHNRWEGHCDSGGDTRRRECRGERGRGRRPGEGIVRWFIDMCIAKQWRNGLIFIWCVTKQNLCRGPVRLHRLRAGHDRRNKWEHEEVLRVPSHLQETQV
jgi:hypothetical protein